MTTQPFYNTGTAVLTNGSTAMVGTGTHWMGNIRAFDRVVGLDGKEAIVSSVTDDTHIVLLRNWAGTTQASAAYEIWMSPDEIFLQSVTRAIMEALQSSALTGIGGLIPAANTMPYFDAGNTAALASLTAFARSILDDANASTALSTLGVSTYIKTLLDDADAGTAQTTLGFTTFTKTLIGVATAALFLTGLGVSTFVQTLLGSTSGAALQIAMGAREVLTAARTYYVRSDGSDANTGLVNNAGGAFLTIQKAINVVAALDISIYSVTIQVADGTYTAGASVTGPWIGTGTVTLVGNVATPGNCILNMNGDNISASGAGARLSVAGFRCQSTSGSGVTASQLAAITLAGTMEFGTCGWAHITAANNGAIRTSGITLLVKGNANFSWYASTGGVIQIQVCTVTVSGTPAFALAFCYVETGSIAKINANTNSGAATGTRYVSRDNSAIDSGGAGATYLPGSGNGSCLNGGQYF